MFNSVKVLDGFSTCFRQWRAEDSHCRFLHGYALSFVLTFEGELDQRNWVFDFGGLKKTVRKISGRTPKEWFDHMFDHTVCISVDDPELMTFEALDKAGIIQLRVLLAGVGCEKFAQYIFSIIGSFVSQETLGRVRLKKVEVKENNKNSASYEG